MSWPTPTHWPKDPIEWVQVEIFFFLHVSDNFSANISRSIKPRRNIMGIENVPREISYKVGHSRISLHLSFNLKNMKTRDT